MEVEVKLKLKMEMFSAFQGRGMSNMLRIFRSELADGVYMAELCLILMADLEGQDPLVSAGDTCPEFVVCNDRSLAKRSCSHALDAFAIAIHTTGLSIRN